jgi:hypothetical protein
MARRIRWQPTRTAFDPPLWRTGRRSMTAKLADPMMSA